MREDEKKDFLWKFFFWVLAFITGLTTSVLSFTILKVMDNVNRITIIESSRCRASDCNDIRLSLADIKGELANLPSDIPPAWFKRQVDENSRDIKELQERLRPERHKGD